MGLFRRQRNILCSDCAPACSCASNLQGSTLMLMSMFHSLASLGASLAHEHDRTSQHVVLGRCMGGHEIQSLVIQTQHCTAPVGTVELSSMDLVTLLIIVLIVLCVIAIARRV